jgi:hypothetical protein
MLMLVHKTCLIEPSRHKFDRAARSTAKRYLKGRKAPKKVIKNTRHLYPTSRGGPNDHGESRKNLETKQLSVRLPPSYVCSTGNRHETSWRTGFCRERERASKQPVQSKLAKASLPANEETSQYRQAPADLHSAGSPVGR